VAGFGRLGRRAQRKLDVDIQHDQASPPARARCKKPAFLDVALSSPPTRAMRTTLVLAVASAYAFAPAHAQDGSGAGCVLACFTRTSKDGCSPADTRCLCANPVFTAGMFGCMRGTCAGAAYTDAENTVLGACQVLVRRAGFDLLCTD
jgi:hypothetical protein